MIGAMLTPNQLRHALLQVNVCEVAKRSGVCDRTIYRIRRAEKRPSVKTLFALTAALESMAPALVLEAYRLPAADLAIAEPAEA